MKKLMIVFGTVWLLCFNQMAWAQDAEEALATVKKSVSLILDDLKENKVQYAENPAALNQMIDEKMVPYFDINIMARYVLGTNWKNATEVQRNSFIREFKQLIMRSYSAGLLDFSEAKIIYGKPSAVKKKRTKIKVSIENNSGKKIPLELSMHYTKGKWLGYDVSMDGLSVITSYRGSIGDEVSRKGIETVINDIKELNEKGVIKQ